MDLVFTEHAEKRLDERFISRQDVENAVRTSDWGDAYGDKKKVVYAVNGKEIEVILKPENNKAVIITVYWR